MNMKIIDHDPAVQIIGLEVSFAPAMIQVKHGQVLRGRTVARCLTQHMRLDVANTDRSLACYVLDTGQIQLSIGTNGNPPKPPPNLIYKLFYGTIPSGGSITQGDFTVKGKAKRTKVEEPKETESNTDPNPSALTKQDKIFAAIKQCESDGDMTAAGIPSVSALTELLHEQIKDEVNSTFRDEWWSKYQAAKLK